MRTLVATLAVLGLAASAAHAQSGIRVIEPIRPIEPITPIMPVSTWVDLSVDEVVGVVDTVAETRVATLRLTGGAVVTCTFWYPAMPPLWSFRPFIAPVPAVMMTRALQSVANNPGSYARPFTLRAWRDRFASAGYGAYSGSELRLFVPVPAHYSGNSSTGGLAEVRLAAAGNLIVAGYQTWGYLTLESESGNQRPFHLLSAAHAASGISPIDAANAEDLCSDVFQSPLWVGFVGIHRDMMSNDRFVHSGTGWWK